MDAAESVDRAAEERRLREARRQSRKRNIGQHGAERLRRIQTGSSAPLPQQPLSFPSQNAGGMDESLCVSPSAESKFAESRLGSTERDEPVDAARDLLGDTDHCGAVSSGDVADQGLAASLPHSSPVSGSKSSREAAEIASVVMTTCLVAEVGEAASVPGHPSPANRRLESEKDSSRSEIDGEGEDVLDHTVQSPPMQVTSDEAVAGPGQEQNPVVVNPFGYLLTLATILCAILSVADKLTLPWNVGISNEHLLQAIRVLYTLSCICLLYLLPRAVLSSAPVPRSPPSLGSADESPAANSLSFDLIPGPVEAVLTWMTWLSRWYEPVVTQCSVYLITLVFVHQAASYSDSIK